MGRVRVFASRMMGLFRKRRLDEVVQLEVTRAGSLEVDAEIASSLLVVLAKTRDPG